MEHDKLTEAMALSMANLDCRRFDCPELGSVDEFRYEDDYRDYMERATAALKALRDTLVPVMYSVEEEAHPIISYIVREKPTECAGIITPLYALPEVKP